MARKRMIDPSLWGDEGFLELSDKAKLLYIGLISHADDEGKGKGSPRGLKAIVFPTDNISIEAICGLKKEVHTHMNVMFYEVDEKEYYKLNKWKAYQSINHPKPSCVPDPVPLRDDSGNDTVTIPERSPQLTNKLTNKGSSPTAQGDSGSSLQYLREIFENFWEIYPKKTQKTKAWEKWKRMKPNPEIFKAIIDGVEKYKQTEQWQRNVIPHPTTFLNQERWKDEINVKESWGQF